MTDPPHIRHLDPPGTGDTFPQIKIEITELRIPLLHIAVLCRADLLSIPTDISRSAIIPGFATGNNATEGEAS